MATAIQECRVCGKLYEACHTNKRYTGVFRWQEVACSPECGSIYLARVEEARKEDKSVVVKDETIIEPQTTIELIEDEYEDELDNELDEYFDDAE